MNSAHQRNDLGRPQTTSRQSPLDTIHNFRNLLVYHRPQGTAQFNDVMPCLICNPGFFIFPAFL